MINIETVYEKGDSRQSFSLYELKRIVDKVGMKAKKMPQ